MFHLVYDGFDPIFFCYAIPLLLKVYIEFCIPKTSFDSFELSIT